LNDHHKKQDQAESNLIPKAERFIVTVFFDKGK
jgi:hypothetical protein